MGATDDDARTGLREAGVRRAAAKRDRAEAMRDIADWAQRGLAAGLPVAEMARLAGVTRQTVYTLTGRPDT